MNESDSVLLPSSIRARSRATIRARSDSDERWARVRSSYAALAAEYAKRIYDELRNKPFDRELLDRFAARVRDLGPVCDLGCGPGPVACYLRDHGVSVFGLDISPAMVSEARRLNPDIDFAEADMLSLPLHPESLGGIAAFHSIIHLKQDELALAFGEMWRALKRDGLLLVAFHVGSEILQTTELWGYRVALEDHIVPSAGNSCLSQSRGFACGRVL